MCYASDAGRLCTCRRFVKTSSVDLLRLTSSPLSLDYNSADVATDPLRNKRYLLPMVNSKANITGSASIVLSVRYVLLFFVYLTRIKLLFGEIKQPFPDKEFYVYDGKPFCRYHYHEANDSLCSDPACGQPIEGACAVAHTGERYHPEHLVCEYRLSSPDSEGHTRCTEQLEEYWEVDGLMLCEKHANLKIEMDIMAPDDDDDDVLSDLVAARLGTNEARDSLHDPDTRAHRRKTRFIDLR